jgi:hypothetical protein
LYSRLVARKLRIGFTIEQTNDLLLQNLTNSKAYTDEQLSQIIQQFYTKPEIDEKILNLQSQVNALSGDVNLSGFVNTTTDQEIDGNKRFLQPVYAPNPIFDFHLATKLYVDTKIGKDGGFDTSRYYTKDQVNVLLSDRATMNYVDIWIQYWHIQALQAVAVERDDRIVGDEALEIRIDDLGTNLTAYIDTQDQYFFEQLTSLITIEQQARISSDTYLQGQFDLINSTLPLKADVSYVDFQDQFFFTQAQTLISFEATERINADLLLKQQIDDLPTKTYIDTQDTDFFNQASTLITLEREERIVSDDALSVRIDNLISDLNKYYAKGEIDNSLDLKADITYVDSQDANAISTAKSYTDVFNENLTNLLSIETQARIAEDEYLQNQVTSNYTNLQLKANIAYVDGQIVSVLESANAYTDEQIASLGHLTIIDEVTSFDDLPTNASVGDVWIVNDGNNISTYVWSQHRTWIQLSGSIDLSNYYTKSEIDGMFADTDNRISNINGELSTKATIEYVDNEVENAISEAKSYSDIGFASVQSLLSVEINDRINADTNLQNQINLRATNEYVNAQDQYFFEQLTSLINIEQQVRIQSDLDTLIEA